MNLIPSFELEEVDGKIFKGELLEAIPQKKRNYIYLAGQISNDIRTYEWREKFTELVVDEPGIVVVNPCANAFNQGMRKVGSNGLEFAKEAVKRSQKILRAKDYQLVKMCNAIVVHLCFSTPEKPMVGTLQELSWARDIFYTPVVAITNGEDNIYTTHPWVDECVSAKVEMVEEAAEMIKTFFLDY
jgi:hypothetical protein